MVTIPVQLPQNAVHCSVGKGAPAHKSYRSYKCRQQSIPKAGARPPLRARGDTSCAIRVLLQELLLNTFNN